jgi:4-amino-4-deoxy-L-arabinose transferase-like glycosyltransferase
MIARNPAAPAEQAHAKFDLHRLAELTPSLIVAYFAAQFIVRLAVSGNLETDEAQFVGHTAFAWGYGNAHPPLYNWLVGLVLWATDSWPAAVSLVKNALLAGTWLLVFDTGKRATGSAVTGLCAAAGLAFMPQVVWQSQFTLAHSVLATFGTAALVNALTRVLLEPRSTGAYLYLGLAAAIGAYGKYNFLLVIIVAALAVLSLPSLRARLANARLALSAGIFALLFGPHLVFALTHIAETTNRIAKLERANSTFGILDIPVLGIDGLFSVGLATLASAAPLFIVWAIAQGGIRATGQNAPALPGEAKSDANLFAQLYLRIAAFGLALFAAVIFFGDFHFVFERYLTPLLLPLPLWLAVAAIPSRRTTLRLAIIAGCVWLAALVAMPAIITFQDDHFAYPYRGIARVLKEKIPPPYAVLGRRDRLTANLVIKLPGTSAFEADKPNGRVLVVWTGNASEPPASLLAELGAAYQPSGALLSLILPYENYSGAKATISARLYLRQ